MENITQPSADKWDDYLSWDLGIFYDNAPNKYFKTEGDLAAGDDYITNDLEPITVLISEEVLGHGDPHSQIFPNPVANTQGLRLGLGSCEGATGSGPVVSGTVTGSRIS